MFIISETLCWSWILLQTADVSEDKDVMKMNNSEICYFKICGEKFWVLGWHQHCFDPFNELHTLELNSLESVSTHLVPSY